MHRCSLRLAVLVLSCQAVVGFGGNIAVLAQTPPITREEQQLTITAEAFCSQTKLRTANARIRWDIPVATLEATGVRNLATGTQTLEATVYKGGFEKGLLVSIPISQGTPKRPVAAQALQTRPTPRAFQFSLIEIEWPKASLEGGTEMSVVVEGLEPGVNYTWRIAIEAPSGRIVSPPVTIKAPVCPADMAPAPSVRKKRKP